MNFNNIKSQTAITYQDDQAYIFVSIFDLGFIKLPRSMLLPDKYYLGDKLSTYLNKSKIVGSHANTASHIHTFFKAYKLFVF
ncbi:TPA: hypothetical protein JBG70_14935 [Legionella pneumophila]|nr:Uncharacterised protein [Legionella pneumophila]HAT8623362.1 hypothetical protein [Legionella pneumophila]HAU0497331.1 hypothetical protein [Legionella pneumophila]HAU0697220.1 hypothetical protein [Legionella pneumophila]HAU0875169.1 hypothetical protein [Legionella pneumophila]